MKRIPILIFAVAAIAQLSVPAAMVWNREQTLRQGRVWKFRTAPVDPSDPFRGRYVVLGFSAAEFPCPESEAVRHNGKAYALLRENAEGFAEVERISKEPIAGDNVVLIERAWYSYDGKQQVQFPFNRYWVDEYVAPQAEKAYAESSRQGESYVTVRIRNGDAALEQLYIEGLPLRQYLRDRQN